MSLSLLKELTDSDVEVVATIDHPYPSPPIHLFDGHLRLSRRFGDHVLVLNWDVSQPLDRFYRYDAITDTGLLAKHPKFYHYSPDVPYALQTFRSTPWQLLPSCFDVAVAELAKRVPLAAPAARALSVRAHGLLSDIKACFSPDMSPWRYTHSLLQHFYYALGQGDLARFIETRYYNYWLSPLTTRWIPWCIRNTQPDLNLLVLRSHGVFKRRPFRPEQIAEEEWYDLPLERIAQEVAGGKLIPSLDVFLWSLAVSGVKHYGNDFGLFQRLAHISSNPAIAALQLTGDEEDCRRFLRFDRDYGILLDILDDSITPSRRPSHGVKLTRLNTFSALLVALGEKASGILDAYRNGRFQNVVVSLAGRIHPEVG